MDHIQDRLDRLAELSDAEVSDLKSAIIAEFETVEAEEPTPASVDAMTTFADMLDSIKAELTAREERAEELAARAAEASARVKGGAAVVEEPVEASLEAEEDEVPAAEEKDEVSTEASVETEETFSTEETPAEAVVEATEEETVEEAAPESEVVEDAPAEASAEEDAPEAVEEAEAPAEAEAAVEEDSAPVETPETEASVEVEDTASEASAEEAAVEETAPETEASVEETIEIAPEAQEEALPVTASAEESFEAPVDRRPVVQATEAPVAITAGADIPGFSAGSTIDDLAGVAVAMEKRLQTIRHASGGDGEQHVVASINTHLPESRILDGSAEANWNKIQDVVGPKALAASGGWATPVETRYDVFGLGTDSRPIRDSLPRFQADRGGISVITPPVLADYAAAVGVWTAANDAAASPNPATKARLTVTGGQHVSYQTDAVTLQLKVGNMFSRAYPELLARHNELALIQHSRVAELNIVSKIDAGSTQVTAAAVLGVARDFIVQMRKAGAAYRNRHRIAPDTQLRAIIPNWVLDAMSADLTMQMPGDDALGQSAAEVNAYLASANITVTASPDLALFGAQNAGALLGFPTSFEWYLFAEGTWLFLDGGSLDIGIVRDSGLIGTNDYIMFMETFEGVAKIGTESLAITSTIAVNGQAAALEVTT